MIFSSPVIYWPVRKVDSYPEHEEMQSVMSLNKKQKKQIDVARQKIQKLRQRLTGAKAQMDDPQEVKNLEQEIAAQEDLIKKVQEES